MINDRTLAEDDLAELAGQLIANFLLGGRRHILEVQAALHAFAVAAKVGGEEGAESGPRRRDLGSDIERRGLLVLVLQNLAGFSGQLGDLGHRLAVEQPAAIWLATQADPAIIGAGQDINVAGMFFRDEFRVDVGRPKDGFQLHGETIGVAKIGSRALGVEASNGIVDEAQDFGGRR